MTIYILLLIFVLFFILTSDLKNRYFNNFFLVILFLLSVFRSIDVGTDYFNYKLIYESVLSYGNYEQLFDYINIYENFISGNRVFEPFFYMIYSIFSSLGVSFFYLNMFLSAIFLILTDYILKKHSVNQNFSLALFFLLFYYFMFFNTNRQIFAILFCILSLFNYSKNKVNFLIWSILAFSSHYTSLIFLIMIPFFKYIRFKKMSSYIAISTSFILGFLIEEFSLLNLGFYQYINELGIADTSIFYVILYNLSCMMIYFVFSFFYKESNSKMVNLWIFGLIIQNLFIIIPSFYRIADYFLIFQIFAIPLLFYNYRYKIVLVIMVSSLFLFNLVLNRQGVVPYDIYQ